MGFSQIVGQLAFIFIFLIMVAFLFNSFRTYTESGTSDSAVLQDILDKKVKTNMDVISSSYVTGFTTLVLENIGSTTLDPNLLDVFSNGNKENRSQLSLTLLNTSFDPLYWNPTEELNITIPGIISGEVLFQVSNQYGTFAYEMVVN